MSRIYWLVALLLLWTAAAAPAVSALGYRVPARTCRLVSPPSPPYCHRTIALPCRRVDQPRRFFAAASGADGERDKGALSPAPATSNGSDKPRATYDLGTKSAPLHLRKFPPGEEGGVEATDASTTAVTPNGTSSTIEEVTRNWVPAEPVRKPAGYSVSKPKTPTYTLGIGKNKPIVGDGTEKDGKRTRKIIPRDEEGQLLKGAIWDEGHYDTNDSIRRAVDDVVRKASVESVGGSTVSVGGSGLLGGALDVGSPGMAPKPVGAEFGSGAAAEEKGEEEAVDDVAKAAAAAAVIAAFTDVEKKNDEEEFFIDPRLEFTKEPPIRHENIDLSVPPSIYDASNDIDVVWGLMKYEAHVEAMREPLLVSFLHSTILNHPSLESALAFHLANKLSSPSMIGTQIMSLISEALGSSPEFRRTLRADMLAVRDRDPACTCLPDVFLYFKGFHALQTHRVAHYLWKSGRRVLAHYLQSQVSQTFQIDIHPNATLGSGIMLDHGTGIVIGETASVGHNCSILHHVTLGGSGKKGVDRHPKVGNGVLLGAGASVLGNIRIGDGCQVGAGTLVIADLPSHTVAVGVPAKIIGSFVDVSAQPALGMNQLGSKEADATIVTFETEGI